MISTLAEITAPMRRRYGISDILFRQITGFLFVGLFSSAAYAGMHDGLIYGFGVDPVLATVPAFLTGLVISYTGNSWLSFSAAMTPEILLRFTIVTLVGLCVGSLCVYVSENFGLPHYVGTILAVSVVPPCNFIGHKFWTYRERGPIETGTPTA